MLDPIVVLTKSHRLHPVTVDPFVHEIHDWQTASTRAVVQRPEGFVRLIVAVAVITSVATQGLLRLQ